MYYNVNVLISVMQRKGLKLSAHIWKNTVVKTLQ